MTWRQISDEVIHKLHKTLPGDISFADRKKAIRSAYPFGERKYFPCKAWLKARRVYLGRYADPGDPACILPLTPMEQLIHETKERNSHAR